MKVLQEFLTSVATLSRPERWSRCLDRLTDEHRHLCRLMENEDCRVYGATTLTGHRDQQQVRGAAATELLHQVILSHAIAPPPFHSRFSARCISFARIYSWAAGMSGIAPEVFRHCAELATDPEFDPEIPIRGTYSCGDVIPAAHWARQIVQAIEQDRATEIPAGQAMPLVNGSFVHSGYAASIVPALRAAWTLFVETSALSHQFCHANRSNLHTGALHRSGWVAETLEQITERATSSSTQGVQDPVSLRSIPNVIEILCVSSEEFLQELDWILMRPSGNPLFDTRLDKPLSQSSFMEPVLAGRTESLSSAILFAMWSICGRLSHLLSGNVRGIPRDAADHETELALIQLPKMSMAVLERARLRHGRRAFAAGASTSYGTEDLWTNGVHLVEQLEELIGDFRDLCSLELVAMHHIGRRSLADPPPGSELFDLCDEREGTDALGPRLEAYIRQGGLGRISGTFPVQA